MVNADRCYNSVYNCVCLRLKLCLPFSETSLFKDSGTIITRITVIWKLHKDRMRFFAWRVLFAYKRVIPRSHCVEVTACKSSHGQGSYLRVLNIFLLAKNIAYWKNKRKILFQNLLFLKRTLCCGDIEENPGVLDQC